MATETTTVPALEATPAADPVTDLSALTTVTAEEPASMDHHDKHDDSNDTLSDQEQGKKRSSSTADLKDDAPPAKVTKRRAARACVSCRARKVRCDVVEGAPCGNCRWDNVECVVQESRRRNSSVWNLRASQPDSSRGMMLADHSIVTMVNPNTSNILPRKNLLTASTAGHLGAEAQLRSKGANPINIHSSAELRRPSNASVASVNGSVAANPVPAAAVPLGATPAIGAGAAAATGIGPGVLGGLSVPGGSSDGLEGHVPHMICE
ncbi:cutinase transcription factor 1 beta [Colletotrichum spaethianum]|uniref:Cutinase transcription factor 1 beta n=1 Tax=Colletotrichum spaethianum TaxID=700344 RepID=A0AA37L2Q9_9PEZI|nr:cutinase transcription factor 1 beta [Colletotrichum spaethianum]GKT40901.1 cutinase transcription factor 1 beta [Colletotrichum spaethianum]